ncbi:MAG: GNAT family N-acetyltransferase, partial [Bryobacteraceae bacterium]
MSLAGFRSFDLDPLLAHETDAWRREFEWDFAPAADLVRRFLDQQALNGFALVEASAVAGYAYYVADENKGLIGDLYVVSGDRTGEERLLEATINELAGTPGIVRVECQVMLLGDMRRRALPRPDCLRRFDRQFMRASLDGAGALRPARLDGVVIEAWADRHSESAARLIPEAYRGHIDSQINDQYHSTAGARRFLHNIAQYPGCGNFFRDGSRVAIDRRTGEVCGLSLASLVGAGTGHITQLCVAPERRGERLGYELLRRSLEALDRAGCRA